MNEEVRTCGDSCSYFFYNHPSTNVLPNSKCNYSHLEKVCPGARCKYRLDTYIKPDIWDDFDY